MNIKTLCFTGHRVLPSESELNALALRLNKEIEKSYKQGYTHFIFGGAEGFDLLAAEEVLKLRNKYLDIKIAAAIPFKGQADNFSKHSQARYYSILKSCNNVITLSSNYHKLCFKNRNKYMIDNSLKVIAYYNGGVRSGTAQTIKMAMNNKLDIVNLF